MLPAPQFWFTGSALFTIGSFALFAILGFAGIASMTASYRNVMIFGYVAAFILFLIGWWQAARQEETSAKRDGEYSQLQTSLGTLQETLKHIADSANINPNQSAQALADEIIKRLSPLKEGLETTKKEVDRLVNPPREGNGLYQDNKMVGTAINPIIDRKNSVVSFQVIASAPNLDTASQFEFKDMILMYVKSGAVSEQTSMGVVTRRDYAQVVCRIVGVRK